MNYKMTIAYDGSRFNGWQAQKENDNTIQSLLEKAISDMLGEKAEINGSGRTDAGVHAKGQVANFKTKANIDKELFFFIISSYFSTKNLYPNPQIVWMYSPFTPNFARSFLT